MNNTRTKVFVLGLMILLPLTPSFGEKTESQDYLNTLSVCLIGRNRCGVKYDWGTVSYPCARVFNDCVEAGGTQKTCTPLYEKCVRENTDNPKAPDVGVMCSGKYNVGHNCHHMAADVCACIKNSGYAAWVGVHDPLHYMPWGNMYHSAVLVIEPSHNTLCLAETERNTKTYRPDKSKSLTETSPECCLPLTNANDDPLIAFDDEGKPKLTDEQYTTLKTNCKHSLSKGHVLTVYHCGNFLKVRGTATSEQKIQFPVSPGDSPVCRVEPVPPAPIVGPDGDQDGVTDANDKCPTQGKNSLDRTAARPQFICQSGQRCSCIRVGTIFEDAKCAGCVSTERK